MRKLSILAIMIFCSFFIVSCKTNDDSKNSSETKTSSTSASSGGKIYFLSDSGDKNEVKANWVTGEANPDALVVKESVKPAAAKTKTAVKTEDTTTETSTDTQQNTLPPPTTNNNNMANNITPEAYFPQDESADPNDIIPDPYDDSSYEEETDDKTSNADEPGNN